MSRRPGQVLDGGDRTSNCGSASESALRRELQSPPRNIRRRRVDSGRGRSDPCGACPRRHNPLARETDKTQLPIIDDFPEVIPVEDRELNAIETYLGALIDEMLQNKDERRRPTLKS